MTKKVLYTLFLSCIASALFGNSNDDPNYAIWQDVGVADSIRVEAYVQYISSAHIYSDPNLAYELADSLINFQSEDYQEGAVAAGYYVKGGSLYMLSSYSDGIMYCLRSIEIYKRLGDLYHLAKVYNRVGSIYSEIMDNSKALDYHNKSLKISKMIGNREQLAMSLASIGAIYVDQKEFSKALEYFFRSIKIPEFASKVDIISAYTNIGQCYMFLEDYSKAAEYFDKGLAGFRSFGDAYNTGATLALIGILHRKNGEYKRAHEFFKKGLNVYDSMNSIEGKALILAEIGWTYLLQKRYIKAIEYCENGYKYSLKYNTIRSQTRNCNCLFRSYKALGDLNNALKYLERYHASDSSVGAQETATKLQHMEFAKQVYADSVKNAEESSLVQKKHKEVVARKNKVQNIAIGGGLIALLLAGGFYNRSRFIRNSRDAIAKEKDRSESLLLNILPAEIAEELKANGEASARDFDEVSILFTDFKEFTQLSGKLSAKELVSELNHCFKAFDAICEKHGIEKIKTLGDSYMATGGLPLARKDSAHRLVIAALEMQDFVIQRVQERKEHNSPPFEMRAGIHTGSVVAGIVGVKKFQYDIWGDTVNTASRMESYGEVGKVNISQVTYELIKDDPRFSFEHRGKVEAKGKGEVDMWFVGLL